MAIAVPSLNMVISTSQTTSTGLPPGCVKPTGGYLIIASEYGYNDSMDHGVPSHSWPVINVTLGQNVTILVCNADPTQPHGFQISYYLDSGTV